MNKPRKHAELIKAWADGEEIQYKSTPYGKWVDDADPTWNAEGFDFRIKQAPIVRWQWVVQTPATDHPELTGGFYKDEAELAKHISNKAKIIGIAEWTRMEFDE